MEGYCTEQCNAFQCGEEAHACDVCVCSYLSNRLEWC